MEQEFKKWVSDISKRYKESREKAWIAVNSEMLSFYYDFGLEIHKSPFKEKNEEQFFKDLSLGLSNNKASLLVFTENNLRKIESFFVLNSDIMHELASDLSDDNFLENVTALSEQIVKTMSCVPWPLFLVIMDTCFDNPRKSWFYITKIVDNSWSKNELIKAIDSKLYERNVQS